MRDSTQRYMHSLTTYRPTKVTIHKNFKIFTTLAEIIRNST